MNFCILGAGAWGTAMALHLARQKHTVTLVPRRMEHALELSSSRENRRYLPGHQLQNSIQIGWELKPVLMEVDVVLLACPSKGLRDVCQKVKEQIGVAQQLKLLVGLSKGLEEGTNLLPSEVIASVLSDYEVGVLTGPTYAGEVAIGKPTAIVFGTNKDSEFTLALQQAISDQSLRVYRTADPKGVGLGSCLKNVYAIAAGICDGLKLGDNAKAALITRSLAEMVRLGTSLGGQVGTFYGLSGFGDLVATCNGTWSRNRKFGKLIAEGQPIESLIADSKMTVEGYRTTDCFYRLCQEKQLEAPILNEIEAVLFREKEPSLVLKSLMNRDLKAE